MIARKMALILALTALPGCCTDRGLAKAVKQAWDVIGPEYSAYVAKDKRLDEAQRRNRLRTVEILTETLDEAAK